ncbi:F510_1955 family glycosylhydrolase [Nocardiopsis sp. SBT366]|uniref:F510_1955 family glycosylhydrolase n=1 Tax=Nocardiopsis sp. SBT366 TaxID=1580529 RepID=UPI00066C5BF6|nr:BNR/Asp-box repeat family protein [Nocardiopsis sp. SBT366]
MNDRTHHRTRVLTAMAAAGLITVTSACAEGGDDVGAQAGDGVANTVGVALPDEAQHVHGAGVDPESGEVLVASHAGLFTLPAPDRLTREATVPAHVGPAIDLMGFAVRGPGHYLASGHPEGDTDMPDPVGLIETRDGGRSWEALSLSGESDFHALASAGDLVVGFDGALRATEDGVDWRDLDPGVEASALAVSDDGRTVVATTPRGPMRSTDGGAGFAAVPEAPPLALVDWVPGGSTVFGVAVDGGVYRSDDAGESWERTGGLSGTPEALHADEDQVIVVADLLVARSTDGGATFDAW